MAAGGGFTCTRYLRPQLLSLCSEPRFPCPFMLMVGGSFWAAAPSLAVPGSCPAPTARDFAILTQLAFEAGLGGRAV